MPGSSRSPTARPAGFLKKRGTVVGRARRPRGAVAFTERSGKTRLLFDRVSVVLSPKGKLEYQPRLGTSAKDWARAANAVGGAGLLMLNGRELTEWADEQLSTGFDTTRHPRTMIGVDAQDAIWLVTVDGRQPSLSLGMSFTELQGLSRRLGLRSSLNLDGGGSTTWSSGETSSTIRRTRRSAAGQRRHPGLRAEAVRGHGHLRLQRRQRFLGLRLVKCRARIGYVDNAAL